MSVLYCETCKGLLATNGACSVTSCVSAESGMGDQMCRLFRS
jgi:hypothetical protein